jgi:hypothetical protein
VHDLPRIRPEVLTRELKKNGEEADQRAVIATPSMVRRAWETR